MIVDVSVLRVSARYNVNKIGIRQSPCGAPIFVVMFSPNSFPILTLNLHLSGVISSHGFHQDLVLFQQFHKLFLLTLSYALLMSSSSMVVS